MVTKECGSCHIAFPPLFLPRRSWQKLVDTLTDHFGENASLAEAPRKAVLNYLLANAADGRKADRQARKFAEGIPAAQTPLRITETPWWVKEHREVRADGGEIPMSSRRRTASPATAAEQGLYQD